MSVMSELQNHRLYLKTVNQMLTKIKTKKGNHKKRTSAHSTVNMLINLEIINQPIKGKRIIAAHNRHEGQITPIE